MSMTHVAVIPHMRSHSDEEAFSQKCLDKLQWSTLVPSVRDLIMRRATEYRHCAQCQRLKRRDSGHKNFHYTHKANKVKQCNTEATYHLINLERKQLQ